MDKQAIYSEMIGNVLTLLTESTRWSWWRARQDRHCWHESHLIHTIPFSMSFPYFSTSDIWFLNNRARSYCEDEQHKTSPLYPSQLQLIAQLFTLTPDELLPQLTWQGPPIAVPDIVRAREISHAPVTEEILLPEDKNGVYRAMLSWSLPNLRNLASGNISRKRTRALFLSEVTLLAPLCHLLEREEFTAADFEFYQQQARRYYAEGDGGIGGFWRVNAYFISVLYSMMPPEYQAQAAWHCPPLPHPITVGGIPLDAG